MVLPLIPELYGAPDACCPACVLALSGVAGGRVGRAWATTP